MHASSKENMIRCRDRYLTPEYLRDKGSVTVLDMGGADVNGSYRDVFSNELFVYKVADISDAEGVEIVMDDPYHIPLPDGSVDLVVSGQMLEHSEFFWLVFEEMVRVLVPDGFLFLIAPSAGPIHRHPVDCYRFYPDAYHALAKYAGCHLLEVRHDQKGPWNDLVGVFAKTKKIKTYDPNARWNRFSSATGINRVRSWVRADEAIKGGLDYLEVLKTIHLELRPETYLEIGVHEGKSFRLATCHAIGVDPAMKMEQSPDRDESLIHLASDEFFESDPSLMKQAPDLIFIDGMHLFEFVLRDFMHCERVANSTTLIVIDDVFPNHPRQAQRERLTNIWTGDVWKIYECLKRHRPDLFLLPIDTRPTGMLLIAGLSPHLAWLVPV